MVTRHVRIFIRPKYHIRFLFATKEAGQINQPTWESIKLCMPYVTGEHPEVGDRVCDRHRRYGTVTHVIMWGSERSELVIKWEDRTIGIRYTIHQDFELLGRKDDQEIVLPAQ
jgi:hypothetical protein